MVNRWGVQRTHDEKIYAMIHQVVLAGLEFWGSGEIDSIDFASTLDLFVVTREAYYVRVEFLQVSFENCWLISGRIAGNHDRNQDISTCGLDLVDHFTHFVEFVRTDIGAVREAKVDLASSVEAYCRWVMWITHQGILVTQVLMGKGPSIMVYQIEGTSDFWFPDALCLRGDSFALDSCSLLTEVQHQGGAGDDEDDACLHGQGLFRKTPVSRLAHAKELHTSQKCLAPGHLEELYP